MDGLSLNDEQRFRLVRQSVAGLAIGDAFGQQFFNPRHAPLIGLRQIPDPHPHWCYTDDTVMAIAVVQTLIAHGRIDQDDLARRFATAYVAEPDRGYGSGAQRLLIDIADGADWRDVSFALFGGQGSMGNGAAMRAAPIGAYFADDLASVIEQADLSAEVTHAHPEGRTGAIAVALAAALAIRVQRGLTNEDPHCLFREMIERLPDGPTRIGIKQAAVLPANTRVEDTVRTLGNGTGILASDTVPFCLWCAFHHLHSYTDGMWTCVAAGGDRDTTAAIVGGIISLSAGPEAIPSEWSDACEPLPRIADGER